VLGLHSVTAARPWSIPVLYTGLMSACSTALDCNKALSSASVRCHHSFKAPSTLIRTIMTEAHALRDELRRCVNNYVLQSRHKRISKASTADLAVMACISSDGPLQVSEAVSWMYHHSDKFSNSIENMISKGSYRQPVSLSDDGLIDNSEKSVERMVKRLEKSPHW